MPGYLRVDFQGAQAIVTALKNNAQARESDISSLSSQANPAAVWEGTAASAYEDKFEQWKTAETNLVNALEQLADVVQSIVNNFDEINQNGAASLGG